MVVRKRFLNPVVAAFLLAALYVVPALADSSSPRALSLLEELRQPDLPNWKQVEQDIMTEWSKSGSPAMDLLLERGREAMDADDLQIAIEHFSALIDHAPDFAEGYNARATAFFREGRYGPALADIRHALALNPHHFAALMGLGAILEEANHPDEALEAYRAAHDIHPHEPDLNKALERLETATSGVTL